MGGSRDIGDVPFITEYGFDESVTQFEGLGERYLATYETLDLGEDSTRNLEKFSAELGKGEIHWEKRYQISARYMDRAIQAIENARKADKPFYINLWTDDIHAPHEPSPANRGDGSPVDHYSGVIKELDRDFGRLFEYIVGNESLRNNTIIVLSSDNGPSRVGSARPFRGGKGSIYEGGIRVPFIVWYPGGIDPSLWGTVDRKSIIAGMDLPASFLSLAGIERNEKYDGIDASAALLGLDWPDRKQPVMWQRPPGTSRVMQDVPDLAIREADFKLLMKTDGSGIELYNTAEDESESRDISSEYPEKVNSLKRMLLDWYSEMPPLADVQ